MDYRVRTVLDALPNLRECIKCGEQDYYFPFRDPKWIMGWGEVLHNCNNEWHGTLVVN